jgi:hypothetical protein
MDDVSLQTRQTMHVATSEEPLGQRRLLAPYPAPLLRKLDDLSIRGMGDLPARLAEMRTVLAEPVMAAIEPSPQCHAPHGCEFSA